MLAFIDESGDTGRKRIHGTGRFFVIAAVIFQDDDTAQKCDDAISRLRRELALPEMYEFHYKDNPVKVKTAFLRCVSSYAFNYYVFAVDKAHREASTAQFPNPEDIYRFATCSVLENAKPILDNARIVLDRRGDKRSGNALATHIRQRIRRSGGNSPIPIKSIKTQRSNGNNLLQLADYVAGIASRTLRGYAQETAFRRQYLIRREANREIWP